MACPSQKLSKLVSLGAPPRPRPVVQADAEDRMPPHLHQAVVEDDEAALGGVLAEGEIVDDEVADLELAADPEQQDAEQHQIDEQQPAEAQEGQRPVPGDQAELAERPRAAARRRAR